MALYAFNGTWNEEEDENDESKKRNTNVVKFRDAYIGEKFYLDGVGTRLGFIGKFLGGVPGSGGRIRIKEAKDALKRNFENNDRTIDIIGFSRGAALALHFANEINEEFGNAEIRFLGLWDVVASFGIPGNDLNFGWTLTLPDNVKTCCHAMALDECRGNFPLTRIKAPAAGLPTADRVQEVWFRRVHSDVGGGLSVGLSSVSLCWMLRRAKENGLDIDQEKFDKYVAKCDADATMSKNFDPKLDPARKLAQSDAVHESVRVRGTVGTTVHNDPFAGMTVVRG